MASSYELLIFKEYERDIICISLCRSRIRRTQMTNVKLISQKELMKTYFKLNQFYYESHCKSQSVKDVGF